MSAAPAPAAEVAPSGGKKKLLIIIGAVVLVLLLGGGAAVYVMMKNKAAAEAAAAEEDEEYDGAKASAHKKPAKLAAAPVRDLKTAPSFVPLDPFTVNLADRDVERYAQVGIALEIEDPKQAEAIKVFMPVIRNNILLLLSHKAAADLIEPEGKVKLAEEIRKEASRALGVEVDTEEEAGDSKSTKKRKRPAVALPVAAVHFSNFIIQ